MNYAMVKRLILKDWYLQRWTILAAVAGGAVSLGIIATGNKVAFILGISLLASVLIAAGAQIAFATMVTERKEQTLTFVMSLPISSREYTAAKLLANLLMFAVPWLVIALGSIALLAYPPGKGMGLIPFTAIMSTEILVSTCLIVAVALISESQGWTIAAIMVGNLALNGIGYWVAHIASIAKGMEGSSVQWTPAASALLFGEFATIVLILASAFFFQARKKDFL
jgi:ABC-2 type transport system permease protein